MSVPGGVGTGNGQRPVRAAGGVLWRRDPSGRLRVAVVHRPKYDDWSLPKGKLEPGERDLAAALREVAEETGYAAEPGPELGVRRYVVRTPAGARRPKVVRYWLLQATSGSFQPGREVDELEWLAPDRAAARCTHDEDAQLIRDAVALLPA